MGFISSNKSTMFLREETWLSIYRIAISIDQATLNDKIRS